MKQSLAPSVAVALLRRFLVSRVFLELLRVSLVSAFAYLLFKRTKIENEDRRVICLVQWTKENVAKRRSVVCTLKVGILSMQSWEQASYPANKKYTYATHPPQGPNHKMAKTWQRIRLIMGFSHAVRHKVIGSCIHDKGRGQCRLDAGALMSEAIKVLGCLASHDPVSSSRNIENEQKGERAEHVTCSTPKSSHHESPDRR